MRYLRRLFGKAVHELLNPDVSASYIGERDTWRSLLDLHMDDPTSERAIRFLQSTARYSDAGEDLVFDTLREDGFLKKLLGDKRRALVGPQVTDLIRSAGLPTRAGIFSAEGAIGVMGYANQSLLIMETLRETDLFTRAKLLSEDMVVYGLASTGNATEIAGMIDQYGSHKKEQILSGEWAMLGLLNHADSSILERLTQIVSEFDPVQRYQILGNSATQHALRRRAEERGDPYRVYAKLKELTPADPPSDVQKPPEHGGGQVIEIEFGK